MASRAKAKRKLTRAQTSLNKWSNWSVSKIRDVYMQETNATTGRTTGCEHKDVPLGQTSPGKVTDFSV
jgi:hypothetical protein